MKKSIKILLHIGFWIGFLLFVAIVMFAALQGEEIPPEDRSYYLFLVIGSGILPPFLSFYGHYIYLFKNYLQKKKLLLAVVGSVIVSILSVLIGALVVMATNSEAFNCIKTGTPYSVGFPFILAVGFGGIALVIKGFFTWYQEIKLKEELLEKNFQMEMALVKSQLDPHFLFNTINNIDVLIVKDPNEASKYLNKLSDIMRFMLYETKTTEIPLSQELEYIEKYIELQKIRTSNQNYINYRVKGVSGQKKVAPMVFIPFIENAFKHSKNKKINHAIDIEFNINGKDIFFKCKNKFEPYMEANNGPNGLGDELIKRRLNLLYPENHQLDIKSEKDNYQVELRVQYEKV